LEVGVGVDAEEGDEGAGGEEEDGAVAVDGIVAVGLAVEEVAEETSVDGFVGVERAGLGSGGEAEEDGEGGKREGEEPEGARSDGGRGGDGAGGEGSGVVCGARGRHALNEEGDSRVVRRDVRREQREAFVGK
jgi:hypothetical protein